jgi:FlaA1/EpsC-like NDP-sugar epimerase
LSGLISLPSFAKRSIVFIVDIGSISLSVWIAFALRFGEFYSLNSDQIYALLGIIGIEISCLFVFGAYRSVIRYFGGKSAWIILKATVVSSVLWASAVFMLQITGIDGVPRTIPVIYAFICTFFLVGVRLYAKWLLNSAYKVSYSGRKTLIFNAGSAGRQLAASLNHSSELRVLGFIDDNPTFSGKDVDGLRVFSSERLESLISRLGVEVVIVASSDLSGNRHKAILGLLEKHKVQVRVLPAISDIASGRHLINMVREVDIGDLLGREPVHANADLLGRCIKGRSVLVTGAGGSIGSELCRQILGLSPKRLVLLEASEAALYQVDRSLRKINDCEVVSVLGSVKDREKMKALLEEYCIDTIYHAAAHKHVPLVESNVIEGVLNNIYGTRSIIEAAYDCTHLGSTSAYRGPSNFILISTDKAVRPTNVMGATKRWAELVLHDYAEKVRLDAGKLTFAAVRFGNVLGSSGSVIPLFKEQITQGGPITVTHSEITRYFMSIHEAVELVIQAGSMAEGGEVFLLDMGEPVKIVDLAEKMIALSGKKGQINIAVTGLRPGEKLYEELLIGAENAKPTGHPKIMKAMEPLEGSESIQDLLSRIDDLVKSESVPELRELLLKVAQ